MLGAVVVGNDPSDGTFAASVHCVASECSDGFGVIGIEGARDVVVDIIGDTVA